MFFLSREIWSLAQKMRSDLPPILWRIGSIEDFEREPEASKVSLCLHLDYLYNGFILERILVQRTEKGSEKLVNVAHELLSNLLLLIANRSSAGEDVNSIVWIVSCDSVSVIFFKKKESSNCTRS